MEKKDAIFLIERWESASKALSPSSIGETTSPEKAELSFFSGRREFWELLVCLLAFAESESGDAEDILKVLADDARNKRKGAKTKRFLNYCNGVATVPVDTIRRTAEIVSVAFAPRRIFDSVNVMTDVERCLELYGDNREELEKCLMGAQR